MGPRVITDLLLGIWILVATSDGKLISVPPQVKIISNKGDTVRFVCKVTVPPHLNEDRLRVKWKHNGHYIHLHNRSEKYEPQNTELTRILVINNVEASDAGVYTCVVNIDGIKDIDSGRLEVREPPDGPSEVSIESCSGNTAELVWKPGNDGGSEILSYRVQFNTSEHPSHWNYYEEDISGSVQTAHINLSPWGSYSFRILAKNVVGYSSPSLSTKKLCTTPPDHPGGNPKDVRTLTHKQGKLIITWTPMPRLLHNGPGFKYVISWRRKGSTYWNKNIVEDSNAKVWEVGVNDTYGLYEIKVKAENDIGESFQPAFIYHGHSGESDPEEIAKDFRVDLTKPLEPHKAHFIWEAVDTSVEKIHGEFKGFKLRYWKSSEGRHKWKEVDIVMSRRDRKRLEVRAAISDLPAYTALRAQVSVMNTHYTGPPSQTIDFSTPEGFPGPVRSLRAEDYGAMFALLRWLPPEEPNGLLLGYDIAYQTISADGAEKGKIMGLRPQINNPDTLGAHITGLLPDNQYRFYVSARTRKGSGENMYLDVKTEANIAQDSPNPKFTRLDHASVNITWNPIRLQHVNYVLEYKPTGQDHWHVVDVRQGQSWMVIRELKQNTEYEVRVIAQNRFGDMASSTLYRVQTPVQNSGRDANFYRTGDIENAGSQLSYQLSSLVIQTIISLTSIFFVFH